MKSDLTKLEEKVAGLIRQAEGAGVTEEESELFRAKAYDLISKYGLDETRLRSSGDAGIVSTFVKIEEPYAREKQILLGGIASALHCSGADYTDASGTWLYGVEGHVQRATMLFHLLWPQQVAGAEGYKPVARDPLESFRAFFVTDDNWRLPTFGDPCTPMPITGEELAEHRRSFAGGYAVRIAKRIADVENRNIEDEDRRADDDNTMSMVLKSDVERAFEKLQADFAESGAQMEEPDVPKYTSEGMRAGSFAGDAADIGLTDKLQHGRKELG